MSKQESGRLGEQLACAALKKKGYKIIETNYRCRQGEIDIIALHKDCLVFIAVRSKAGNSFGSPEESVTTQKKQRLISTAMDYLSNHQDLPENWRIDFVAVELDPLATKATRIEIIENAVE
ncbi:MAG: YraN family protein [Chloroflexi bacterium]|nr:YraN family protein [Chloroflexota bacterium]